MKIDFLIPCLLTIDPLPGRFSSWDIASRTPALAESEAIKGSEVDRDRCV